MKPQLKTIQKSIFFIFISIITVNSSFALQDFKFGKVPKELLNQQEHPKEKDASAAVIYQNTKTSYNYNDDSGWSVVREVTQRIKIYDKDGLSWANSGFFLYKGGEEDERYSGVKGITSNIENGKTVQSKLNKSGVFKEKHNKFWDQVKFTLPNVKEGSVIDLQYKVSSPYATYLDEFKFQYSIPVDYAKVSLNIPEFFIFKRYSKGYFPLSLTETSKNRSVKISWRESSSGTLGGVQGKLRSESWDFKETGYTIEAKDVPSMKSEQYTNNINNYRSAIKFELTATKSIRGEYKTYSNNWGNVAKRIYDLESFGAEIKKTSYFTDDLKNVLSSAKSENDKIGLIYSFVKSRMNWNRLNGYTTDNGVRKAYKEKSGNVADINLMLTSMLQYAGLDAYPILVSTKSHGIPLFPTRLGFNYVISGVYVGENLVLLDATEKFSLPNILPVRAMNWEGRLIRKDGSSIPVSLISPQKTKERYLVNASISEDGSIKGKISMQCTDQMAMYFRKEIVQLDEDAYLENLEKKLDGIEISDYEIKNTNQINKPIQEQYNFYKDNAIEIINDKIYIDPLLMFTMDESPFKIEKREFPVDFSYPYQQQYMITFKIPDGYQLTSLPEKMQLGLPDNIGIYKYRVVQNASQNQIQVICSRDVNATLVSPVYYEALKEYYEKMVNKESEKVVLSKI